MKKCELEECNKPMLLSEWKGGSKQKFIDASFCSMKCSARALVLKNQAKKNALVNIHVGYKRFCFPNDIYEGRKKQVDVNTDDGGPVGQHQTPPAKEVQSDLFVLLPSK